MKFLGGGAIVTLPPNLSGSFFITTANTTTLLLRRLVCPSSFIFWCSSTGFADLAVFDDVAFWTLFGGQMTIERL